MADSLLLADLFELAGAEDPRVQTYTLGGGYSFGDPTPNIAFIASLLDGDRQTGRRSGNRQHSLPIVVQSSTRGGLSIATNALLEAVDVETFLLQWTPDGGLPLQWVCGRSVSTVSWSQLSEAAFAQVVTLTFSAQPFGRSPESQSIAAAVAQLQLDSFDPTTPPSGATRSTSTKYEGTASAQVALAKTNYTSGSVVLGKYFKTSTPVARTYASAQDLSPYSAVTMRVRWNPPQMVATPRGGSPSNVNWTTALAVTLTLTSAAGNVTLPTQVFTVTTGSTKWNLLSFPLTALGSLNPAAVTGYSIVMESDRTPTSLSYTYDFASSTSNSFIDDQRALPPASAGIATTRASALNLPAILGSARSPANIALVNVTATAFRSFLLHAPPPGQDPDTAILSQLDATSTNQTVTVPQANAGFEGTYSVVLGVGVRGSGSVTATVTVTQLENGTPIGSTTVLARTYATGSDLVPVGDVTLPLYDVPDDNNLTSYTIQVQISGTDRYSELMLCDTRGQTIYNDSLLPASAVFAVYVDEPSATRSGPGVYASATNRTAAYSILGNCIISGGPILLDPGNNRLMAWVSANGPSVQASYYPRWLAERADVVA